MKALVQDEIGKPLDVLRLREIEVPTPGPGEVLVRMTTASINPGDFLFVEALYPEPKKPALPGQIAGNHGAGVVERVGAGVTIKPGTEVGFSYFDTWSEFAVVPEEWLIPLPRGMNPELGAQLVNLITAWDLLERSRAKPGDFLALTAGHSTVSILTAQYAASRGIKVISVVRRKTPDIDLLSYGSEHVIETSSPIGIRDAVLEITSGKGLNGVIDHVGGPLFPELVRSSALGSRIVVNGVLSSAPYELHHFDILMNLIEIVNYVYRYFFEPPTTDDRVYLQQLLAVSTILDLRVPVAGFFSLENFREAIEGTLDRPEEGKRFFSMRP
ncbi:hypothetical protein SAMIE_1004820 [Sphingobium amiense]|uniref:Enoyl reductase (ER) domain-containing protein n=1 Tax=Sphingobium amiense TaxID=135719 RepID=A0A494VYN2_9SPHN|nr:zinc-binding dehydrogenase [Sphingobium amiense]BBD96981.1 hypothetical protein SAMIE_1004820 [Sphingobium amiense]